MTNPSGNNRTVSIGGNVSGSVILTGNNNVVSQTHMENAPAPEDVDIVKELAAFRELLAGLGAPDQKKIGRALDDADDELKKPDPDKEEVQDAVARVVKYAGKADDITQIVDKLKPHALAISSWLGTNLQLFSPLFGG